MDKKRVENAIKELLLAMGEDPCREGLLDTPRRVADMYEEMFSSYEVQDVDFSGAVFNEGNKSFVLIKDIPFNSVCEHHIIPFVGKFHIAYLPCGKVLGLSKFARIVDLYAKRLQLQERLTQQVADKINSTLSHNGLAILCEAEHLCMTIRGVKKQGAKTITTHFSGEFEKPEMQQLFFSTLNQQQGE